MSGFSVRRVVTGHDAGGKAAVVSDEMLGAKRISSTAERVLLWSTQVFPSDNQDETDGGLADLKPGDASRTTFGIVTLEPRSESPIHRTVSLDYCVVIDGQIDLALADGVVTTIRRGEVVVQRGTLHGWNNTTDEPCVMAVVVTEASPVRIGDQELTSLWLT